MGTVHWSEGSLVWNFFLTLVLVMVTLSGASQVLCLLY